LLHPCAAFAHRARRCAAKPSTPFIVVPAAQHVRLESAIDASTLHLSTECNSVRANVYRSTSETRDKGSGGAGQDMQAGAIGTDVHATKTARTGTDGYAPLTTERLRESHRLGRPPRKAA
jgi:hypothetical protein